MKELQDRLVIRGANRQFYFHVAGNLLGLNADHAHATRQNALEIHEHLRPIETAQVDDAVDEVGAIVEAGDLLLGEKALEFPALRFVPGPFLARLFRAGAKFLIRFASNVDVPTQGDKNDERHEGGKAGAGKKAAVRFERLGG
jgi:hypothetical protein